MVEDNGTRHKGLRERKRQTVKREREGNIPEHVVQWSSVISCHCRDSCVIFIPHESWTHARNVMDSVLQATWFVCFYFFERSRLKKLFFLLPVVLSLQRKLLW